jgi:hypothetical protein
MFYRLIFPNGEVRMPPEPAHADPADGPGDPAPPSDWMSAAEWEAWCDLTAVDDEPPPDLEDEDEEEEPELAPEDRVTKLSGFGRGGVLDGLAGGHELAFFADAAAGPGDRYAGASDDELDGVIRAWDRVEAHAAARKHAAVAEFLRRRPEAGCEPGGPGGMPGRWDEFAVDELRVLLAESRAAAEQLMSRASDLASRLPGTLAVFRSGRLRQSKVAIVVNGTGPLDADESRAAEDLVLGRAERLTPGGLRAAIARAVMEVAPGKARKRREDAARDARVERWAEDSGNAALMGRELGQDSRPQRGDGPAQQDVAPGGVAVRGTLTVPLVTLAGLADRPGQMSGTGPLDPWLARDLAHAAAASPRTTWCVTVTDEHGHAVGHGCGRPEPRKCGKREKPGTAGGARDGPADGFSLTPEAGRDGPPAGSGTWRLRTPGPGPDLIIELVSLITQDCDHRFQAQGHDPGVRLRHLAAIRHGTCASPVCRRPARQCDFEHNIPYEAGGRTCLCNAGPKCRHDHRVKQHPRWNVTQHPDGTFTWTTPSGRSYTTEPTRYPI